MPKVPGALTLALILTLAGALPQGIAAQTSADSAAIVLGLATQLHNEGKRELAATLFQLILERYPASPSADSARAALRGVTRAQEQSSGVSAMMAWGGLYGAWVGLAVPAALNAQDPSAYGAGLLIGTPVGLFSAKGYAKAAGLSGGQARGVAWGSIWGSLQGLGWRRVLHLGDHTVTVYCPALGQPCLTQTETSQSSPYVAALLGGFAGIGTAAALARSREMSSGAVASAQWGSIWGSWFAGATTILLDLQDDDQAVALTLIGGDIGLITAAQMARHWNVTSGRPWLVSAVGIAGLVAGLGVDLVLQPEDTRAGMIPPMAGSIAGLVAGVRLTRPRDGGPSVSPGSSPGLLRLEKGKLTLGEPLLLPSVLPRLGLAGRVERRPVFQLPVLSVALP